MLVRTKFSTVLNFFFFYSNTLNIVIVKEFFFLSEVILSESSWVIVCLLRNVYHFTEIGYLIFDA